MKKRIFTIYIAISLVFLSTINFAKAYNTEYDNNIKIHDDLGLFSSEAIATANEKISYIIDYYGYDVAIITSNEYNGSDIKSYADTIYDSSNYGIGSNKIGLIMVINMKTRKIAISTMESTQYFSTSHVDSMIRDIGNSLKNENYDEALNKYITTVSDTLYIGDTNTVKTNNVYVNSPLITLLVPTITTAIWIFIVIKKHRPVKIASEAGEYVLPDSFILDLKEDIFLYTHTSVTPKPKSNSGGRSRGGSSRGGSSGSF